MLLKSIIISLALSTAVSVYGTAVNTKNNGKYLEDFVIINASNLSEARQKAQTINYEISNTPLSSYGENHKYIACKYTNDKENALTDIRAMNMIGGFSSEAYKQAMEDKKDETGAIINNLYTSVLSLKNNYQNSINNKSTKGVDGVIYSYDVLNYYQFDDLVNPSTNAPYTMAELLTSSLSETELKEYLTTIFMQGNAEHVSTIEKALMHAATSQNDALDLEELGEEDMDYNDYDDPTYETTAAYIAGNIETIQNYIRPFANSNYSYTKVDETNEKDFEKKTEDYLEHADSENKTSYSTGYFVYLGLSSYSYHHDGITENLADFFLNLDTDAEDFDNKIFYPFVAGMNEAQIGCLPYAGLDTLIAATIYKKFTDLRVNEKTESVYDYGTLDEALVSEVSSDTKVSVFDGIDRSVFEAESVALTNSALRQNNSKNDFNWFREEAKEDNAVSELAYKIAVYSGITALSAVAVWGATYAAVYAKLSTTLSLIMPEITKFGIKKIGSILLEEIAISQSHGWLDVYYMGGQLEIATAKSVSCLASVGFKIMTVFGTIALVALAVCIIAYIIYKIYEGYVKEKIEYVDIPEIMVDEEVIDNTATYSYYNVVKDENGNPQTTTYYKEAEESQWVALYKTKDSSRGNPILAKDLRLTGYYENDSEDYFTSVRKFGETSQYNVLSFYDEGESTLYLGYRTEEPSNTASIFSNGIGLAIIFLLVGLAGGAAGGIFTYKYSLKKKEQK